MFQSIEELSEKIKQLMEMAIFLKEQTMLLNRRHFEKTSQQNPGFSELTEKYDEITNAIASSIETLEQGKSYYRILLESQDDR